jgi:hypothetical protein
MRVDIISQIEHKSAMSFSLLNPGSAVVRLFRSLNIALAALFLSTCLLVEAQPIFRPPVTNYWRRDKITAVATGDVNNDGWADIIVAGGNPWALTNDHHEGFAKFDYLPNTDGVVLADFDADGYADIMDPSGMVVTNKGAGLFGILSRFTDQYLIRTIVADFNGDNLPDMANAYNVLTNDGIGTFSTACTLNLGYEFTRVIATVLSPDVNDDGRADLFFVAQDAFLVLTNGGNDSFGILQSNRFINWPGYSCTIDLNRDGRQCVVIPQYECAMGTNLVFLTNNASGVFGTNMVITVQRGPQRVIAGDVNGDGADDLLCQFFAKGVLVLTNDLHGGFATNSMIDVYSPILLADLNADGRLDLFGSQSYEYPTNFVICYNASSFSSPSARPPLSLKSSGKGMDLSWPVDSKGWSLRCTRDLASPEWLPAGVDGYPIETKVTNKTLHVQPSATPRFYRLMHPAAE